MDNESSADIPVVEWPGEPWTRDETQRVARAVGDACRRYGYFFLKQHGVSPDLLAAAFNETQRFYSLSLDQKRRFNCSVQSQFLGYRGLGAERSLMHAGGEACEQYRIGNFVDRPETQAVAALCHQPFSQGTILLEELETAGKG